MVWPYEGIVCSIKMIIMKSMRDFPGGPVVKTPCFQCRAPGFDPWSGNYIPHAITKSPRAAAKIQCS